MEEPLSPEQAALGYALIRSSDEIESISDYCARLAIIFKKTQSKEESKLSEMALSDLKTLLTDIIQYYEVIRGFYTKRDLDMVEEYQMKARQLQIHTDRVRKRQMDRIRIGECPPLSGLAFSDMVVAVRRISNHTVNIMEAVASSIPNIKGA